ncbi:MAG: Fic family protein [Alphaproteobacteria bacterium]|nr:Fic family protein [Alphaproteobacteria bacterium]
MTWNWEQSDWPAFTWDDGALDDLEARFMRQAGVLSGALRHVNGDDTAALTVELISAEAVKTSEIEGEILDRNSVQSSIKRHFGLATDNARATPAERGIADMMVDVYRTYAAPLSHETLFKWHEMLAMGRRDLTDVGCYRTHEDAMQVVSGAAHAPTIHFEAPPSPLMAAEMTRFITWFNDCGLSGTNPLPPLTRAGLAHLHFVSIHPFEDGNGRIGRAISDMALSQSLGHPSLLALSHIIQAGRKIYYDALAHHNKDLDVTGWLLYFAETVLGAQDYSLALVEFLIAKTQLFDRLRGQLNIRQDKALDRMFREGLEGFKGGLSAENYISITGTKRATASRDLADLVKKGALLRTGERRYTRYWLNV